VVQGSGQEVKSACTLYLESDFPVQPSRDACDTAREKFTSFRSEAGEDLRVFVVEFLHRHVEAAAWEAAVGAAQIHCAFRGLRLHRWVG